MKIKIIIFCVIFFQNVYSGDKKNEIKHRYIENIAKKILSDEIPLSNQNYLSCSPDTKYKVWICYVDLTKNLNTNNFRQVKLEEDKRTLIINFINSEFLIYKGHLREFEPLEVKQSIYNKNKLNKLKGAVLLKENNGKK
jgi:hypothetical protein